MTHITIKTIRHIVSETQTVGVDGRTDGLTDGRTKKFFILNLHKYDPYHYYDHQTYS